MVRIQIPIDAEPGDSLSFAVDGQCLEIEIPPGSQPGDILEVQVGETVDATQDDVKSSFELSSGENLRIITHLSADVLEQTSNATANCDGTHALAWPAGLALVRHLDSTSFDDLLQDFNARSLLELGSGLGIAGLVFAHAIAQRSSGIPVQVILTDVPAAIPLLNRNIQHNQHLLSNHVQARAVPLVWHSFPSQSTTGNVDWIIGSDLLYNTKSIPDLVATTQRLMSADTKILLSVRWRKPEQERTFFSELASFVDWGLLEGPCPLSWENYGNPDCDESNCYFASTMVSTQGRPTCLAEIDESDTDRMTSEEFEAWERLQIQIYLGKPKGQSCGVKRTLDSTQK